MVTPLLNNFKQWLVINATTGPISQIVLLDEQAQEMIEKNSNARNVTLVGKDKIALLNH